MLVRIQSRAVVLMRLIVMNRIRIVIAAVAAFGFLVVYNGLVHLVILAGPNKQTEHLRRVDFS